MENFRSNSCREQTRMQVESYYGSCNTGPKSLQDLRSYSANYTTGSGKTTQLGKEMKMKKGKGNNGSVSKCWSLNDAELQRKKRVAGYKVYGVEGKMKASLTKSFRWIKNTYTHVVHGSWG